MLFSIPILVEENSEAAARLTSFVVRPLLHAGPVARADKLSRALNRLTSQLQELLTKLGREPRHDALAEWTFHPIFEETTLELRLELNSGSQKCQLFFAGYPALERKLYFTPAAPDLHFEVLPNQTLVERATAVLTQHFRAQEKEGTFHLDTLTAGGKARLTTLEIELDPSTLVKGPAKPKRALLFGSHEKKDGEVELRKTGCRLKYSYPDDLDRAVDREREVAELARLLAGSDRRPIVLVGPRQVGKTAIIHELVWRICAGKPERYGGGRDVWLVSPARLISGMSYLGEWENRVLAIFGHAQAKDKVLYFDDLLGLFTAGVSSASDLNVAQVLKPVLEKRSVRVLAEITREAWQVLRERDRAFADFFHVIPVAETTEAETLHVLTSVTRLLEDSLGGEFSLAVVPLVFDLFRRFGGDAAFPGKAAGFLKRLAVRSGRGKVDACAVLSRFQEQTGLHPAFLGASSGMTRPEILARLREQVVGQDHALDAFADVLVKLKARLNDPRRPLGTFLLLGPTGVGKTQAAKALAKFLFGQDERLVRFDLNEYVDAAAAARLTGTPRQPEGLLTGAIRRQPFSVLLFDEIEKAAPEVFDLLLAVLDEGRLTDALGRVADFTHAIIVLTSNLGAREARSRLGFGAAAGDDLDEVFVGAAEKFFRPEFFNRLDRIIPFRALAPAQLAGIAQRLVHAVFAREGLRRRDCLVEVFPSALTQLVKLGYQPQLGARALKRVVERELAQPLARQLAAAPPGTPTLATFAAHDGQFHLRVEPLRMAPQTVSWATEIEKPGPEEEHRPWVAELAADAQVFLDRIGEALERSAPDSIIVMGRLSPEQERYAAHRGQWLKVERLAKATSHSIQPAARGTEMVSPPKPRALSVKLRRNWSSGSSGFGRKRANVAMRVELHEMRNQEPEAFAASLPTLLREAVWLEALLAQPADEQPIALVFRALSELDQDALACVTRLYRQGIASLLGEADRSAGAVREQDLPPLGSQQIPAPATAIWCQEGPLRRVLPAGESCILVRRADGTLGGILVSLRLAHSAQELRALLAQESEPADGGAVSASLGPVIHSLAASHELTDFRSGLVVPANPSPDQARAFLLSALPLPAELNF
jgi:ATP-dependent Clp protease ATP-binding subunit ClpA